MISFEELPDIVRYRIYEYLLKAEECKAPPDNDFREKYEFHTAVLRVSKSIHVDAQEIFDKNHFILISSFCNQMLQILNMYRVCIFRQSLTRMRNYHMRLHITYNKKLLPPDCFESKPIFFVVPIIGVDDLVEALRIDTYMCRTNPRFMFEIQASVAQAKIHKKLLEPFKVLDGPCQKCSIKGNVDTALAESVVSSMTPNFIWTTAMAWAVYERAVNIKAMADRAFLAQKNAAAFDLYAWVTSFTEAIYHSNSVFYPQHVHHSNYWNCWNGLIIICTAMMNQLNLEFACLSGETRCFKAVTGTEGRVRPVIPVWLPVEVRARREWQKSIANFGLRNFHLAFTKSAEAAEIDLADPYIRKTKEVCQKWKELSDVQRTSLDHKAQLLELLGLLPPGPISTDVLRKQEVCEDVDIDRQRYFLRRAGYRGSLLEDRITQIPGLCLSDSGEQVRSGTYDAQRMDKPLRDFMQMVAENKRRGLPALFCVKPPPSSEIVEAAMQRMALGY